MADTTKRDSVVDDAASAASVTVTRPAVDADDGDVADPEGAAAGGDAVDDALGVGCAGRVGEGTDDAAAAGCAMPLRRLLTATYCKSWT